MKTNWPALRNGCLILASLASNAAPLLSQTRAAAAATTGEAVISSVAVTQAAARSSVRVEGEGELFAHATRMQNPDRLVLDFADTRMAVQKTVIPGVSAPVRTVRLGQFRPDVARVVIDLTASAPYQIEHEGGAVVIYLEAVGQPASGTPPANLSTVETAAKEISHSANSPQVNSQDEKSAKVAAPQFSLPSELTQPSAALATPSEKPETAHPAGSAQQAVQQATTAATTVAAQQAAGQTPSAQAAPSRYTGEPISVNLKDVDLKDFFRLIHEISGLNVVLDPNVKGTLTIVLDEVPWDQAL